VGRRRHDQPERQSIERGTARPGLRKQPGSAEDERTNERDAFLDAIRESPDDDTPRLMFADWLKSGDRGPGGVHPRPV
jgi:uncharacterized protein (TIGR02996 family)